MLVRERTNETLPDPQRVEAPTHDHVVVQTRTCTHCGDWRGSSPSIRPEAGTAAADAGRKPEPPSARPGPRPHGGEGSRMYLEAAAQSTVAVPYCGRPVGR